MLHLVPIPAFRDNYIWLLHDDDGRCLVVDPGDAEPVLTFISEHDLTLGAILITHHHPDHTGGINRLLEHAPVPVYGPARETIPACSHPVDEGSQIRLETPELTLNVYAVPGHTLGHVAYHLDQPEAPLLFCGDTLFSGGCGRLFEGTPADMLASLDRLAALPAATWVCCTHEYTESNLAFALSLLPDDPALLARQAQVQALRLAGAPSLPSSIEEERASNIFLRCDDPAVKHALREEIMEPGTRLSVFTALRARKDHF
jgi:hydroxyacylglutathione hydrolase